MRVIFASLLLASLVSSSAVLAQDTSLRDHIIKDTGVSVTEQPPATQADDARTRMQQNIDNSQNNRARGQVLNRDERPQDFQRQKAIMRRVLRQELMLDDNGRSEPFFEPVKFQNIPEAGGLSERVDRLVQGITIDVPPKYDHYGHEVRRYMASVSGPQTFQSKEAIQEQIKNIKAAEIIMDYWFKSFRKEARAIEALIEERDASSNIRTAFKYNRGVADAFFMEAFTWAKNNRLVLEHLAKIPTDDFEMEWPKLTFKDQKQFKVFKALLEARQKSLEQIQEYTPFRVMVY